MIYFQICIFEPLETTGRSGLFRKAGCDLLSNLYLWTIGNNSWWGYKGKEAVVIYFQICIFEPLETTFDISTYYKKWLWFTFKFVSLNHWKQLKRKAILIWACCDLLSNLYLWTIGNNVGTRWANDLRVVIYFQICIFEPLETTIDSYYPVFQSLWFTFKFVSLNHWKQLITSLMSTLSGCDLLSNLYLWTIGNN